MGHGIIAAASSGLPPQEAPVMIAEKGKDFSFLAAAGCYINKAHQLCSSWFPFQPILYTLTTLAWHSSGFLLAA